MDWREFLEKNADINDHYDDINEKTARNQSNYYKRDFKYNKDKKEITDNGRPNCTNCDANAQETRKKFPKAQLKRMVGTVRHDGKDKEHAWNINPKGHIIDGARDQFGDEKKIHIIKPNDKKHKEYTTGESHINRTPDHLYGRSRKKLNRTRDRAFNEGSYKRSEDEKKITTGMESLKSWESWLEKVARNPMGLKGNRGYNTRLYEDPETHHVGIHDNKNDDVYEISGTGSGNTDSDMHKETKWNIDNEHFSPSKKPKGTSVSTKTASWESWLDKNNAIETSHKDGEKKEEWDGKFSSSTIKDPVDDKAMDEESDEIMEDAGLEEVEKLKSWEVFLDKMGEGGTSHAPSIIPTEQEKEKRIFNKNPPKNVKGHFANSNTEKPPIKGTKIIQTDRKGTFHGNKDTDNMSPNDNTAVATRVAASNPDYAKFMTDVAPKEQLGSGTDKRVETKEEKEEQFIQQEREKFKKQQEARGRKPANPKAVAASRKRFNLKSWEVWLEKAVTHEDPTKGVKGGMTKVPITQAETPEEIMEAAKDPKTTIKLDAGMKKSWKSWLEKMQGAGDARFGNQHLTGLDQKPVDNEEDEANILPEKDEKQEKTEQNSSKQKDSNKPYKA